MKYDKLILEAIKAKDRAYAPYSKFNVGAAVLTEDNNIYSGCNIENASYGATNCAERTAIFKAVSEGYRKIKAIAIVGNSEYFTYPCGICRQVISEFALKNMEIIIVKSKNEYIIKTLEDILPQAFTKKDLK
ncbi:cytidine deaminase [Clostridium acetireducens DSM 10703]|uniref:Cytidine deaminase n=1 Tax=Clostridium acetireducens DSM 10703 TaxID=1121290 RepID=A0A1E8F159_9CLOT|nr:cytidine deaminase [Clostridium acetireducens]OFI07178.1 cytidine deaminase [Clostridium acetireducens DSM 10703]